MSMCRETGYKIVEEWSHPLTTLPIRDCRTLLGSYSSTNRNLRNEYDVVSITFK
jgi:hypothetical protein